MNSCKTITYKLFLLCTLALLSNPVQGYRAIPEDNLSYPVLINLWKHGKASGFYLRDDDHLYLVTARHVLFAKSDKLYSLKTTNVTCLSYPKDPNDPGRIKLELNLDILNKNKLIKYHKAHDAAIVRIANLAKGNDSGYKLLLHKGVKILEHAKTGLIGGEISNTKIFDKILIGNEVYVFGYPTSIGIKEMPQIDPNRPLLRKGIIGGTNKVKKQLSLIAQYTTETVVDR